MEVQTIQPPAELATDVGGIRQWAATLVVRSKDEYADASERLKQIKTIGKRIADWFSPMKKSADKTKRSILDAEKSLATPLAEAEANAKKALLKFQMDEQSKADAERRRLQAIADEQARKEREQREAEAQRQRDIEAEAQRKAEEARKQAAEADSAAERKRLQAIAQRAESKAAAAGDKAESKAAEAAAVQAPTVTVASEPPKVAGQQIRKAWKHQVTDLEKALLWCCKYGRTDLLILNENMVAGMATSLKERANLPGVRFFEQSTLASKGA